MRNLCQAIMGWTFFLLTHNRFGFFPLPSGKGLKCRSASTTSCGRTDTAVTHKWHWRIPVLIPSFINLSVCKENNFGKYQAPPGVSSAFVLSFHIPFPTFLPLEDCTNDSAQRTLAHLPTAVPPLQHIQTKFTATSSLGQSTCEENAVFRQLSISRARGKRCRNG